MPDQDRKTVGSRIVGALAGVRASVVRFWRESKAVSTVEYGLITVAVVVIVGVSAAAIGGAFEGLFTDLAEEIEETADGIREGEPEEPAQDGG